jgi:hypothetical protein
LQASLSVAKRGGAVALGLCGWATARASAAELAVLRGNPGLPGDRALVPGFLKNSDDQTVLALAVISEAINSLGRPTDFYRDWGIIAAANLFGRSGTFQALLSFRKDGAWGITPHMIPHHSLHAVSGTVSQALQMHGPNFGIGGGPNAAAEALLTAATLISEDNLPGLWVVMTGHEPECLPSVEYPDAQLATDCLAAAIAVQSPISADCASFLHIARASAPAGWPTITLPDFLAALETKRAVGHWALPGGGWAVLGGADGREQA